MKKSYFILSIISILITLSARSKYIDGHVHIACFGYRSDCYISSALKESFKFYGYQYLFGLSEKKAIQKGDQILFQILDEQVRDSKWVKQVVLLAMDQVYDKKGVAHKELTEFYIPNDYISKNIKKYSTFLLGASVHPYRKDALEELEKVKKEGAVLIKLLPAIQQFSANDPDLKDYYLKLKELSLPLLIHMDDENSFTKDHKEYSNPHFLEFPLKLGVTVICAHGATRGETGGKSNFDIFVSLAKKYKNLYADISALLIKKTRFRHIEKILKFPELHDQFIYGSDYPLSSQVMSSPYFYKDQIGFFKSFRLTFLSNTWDRDVELKKAFGVPEKIFLNTEMLLIKK